jgi:hypothetical protein
VEILEEAKRYVDRLDSTQTFLEKTTQKGRTLRQGDYTFAGIR